MGIPVIRPACGRDVEELAELAADTFPLACPPELAEADIAAFIGHHLSPARFRQYLDDPSHAVLVAEDGGRLDGYVLMIFGPAAQPEPDFGVRHLPSAYLSKCYVRLERHGHEVAAALLARAKRVAAREMGASSIWLNTNEGNARARRFYEKHGFVIVGAKTMQVGSQVCRDHVFECVLGTHR